MSGRKIGRPAGAAPRCPYCGREAKYVSGVGVYPHRPDLDSLRFWRCTPCEAWVGCHRGTSRPLGELADRETRHARLRAHAIFDPLWKATGSNPRPPLRRRAAYLMLADELGRDVVHIADMDATEARAVVGAVARIFGMLP